MASPVPELRDDLRARGDALIELRRDLHRHPEFGFQERRTAALVAERLHRAGHEHQSQLVCGCAKAELGDAAVEAGEPVIASDDMSRFLDQRPGCYFRVGAAPRPRGTGPPRRITAP